MYLQVGSDCDVMSKKEFLLYVNLLMTFVSRWYTSCSEAEEDSCIWGRRPSELSKAINRR